MPSALQEIADTLSTDFRGAVIDAERADVETIENVIKALNEAYEEFTRREQVLDTKAEEALKTLDEIGKLRDVNATTYNRRISTLRDTLAAFRSTKIVEKAESEKVLKLVNSP